MGMSPHRIGVLVSAWLLAGQFPPATEWTRADAETVRLPPVRIAGLPSVVRAELDRRGCSIPQPFSAKADRPENAIRGHFTSPAAIDWAVLCSRQRRSSVLVFRGGGVEKIDELAAEDDISRLQVTGPGQIGYSRAISASPPSDIRQRNPHADPPLPVLDHDGIHDAFIGKASVAWYWSGTTWMRLAGANAPTSGPTP
jgi:hypothetical protein